MAGSGSHLAFEKVRLIRASDRGKRHAPDCVSPDCVSPEVVLEVDPLHPFSSEFGPIHQRSLFPRFLDGLDISGSRP